MSHLKQLPGNISRTHILCEKKKVDMSAYNSVLVFRILNEEGLTGWIHYPHGRGFVRYLGLP